MWVRIWVDEEPSLSGTVEAEDGTTSAFDGWLQLLSVLAVRLPPARRRRAAAPDDLGGELDP